jgi:LemA protein
MISPYILAVVAIVIGFLIYLVIILNDLIRLRNAVKQAWSNIDVILRQRYDEVPNLVATVKGYAAHERNTIEAVTRLRTQALNEKNAGANTAYEKSSELSKGIHSLYLVAENYPDLKANQNFLQLQQRLTGLENTLADRREFYNEIVTNYNNRIMAFPDTFIAHVFGMKQEELFTSIRGKN